MANDPRAAQLRRTWLSIGLPTLALGVSAGAMTSGLWGPGWDTLGWFVLGVVALVLGRTPRIGLRRVGWLVVAVLGFVLAVLTAPLGVAMAVLFLGAPWLVVGAVVLVNPVYFRTSGVAIVAIAVATLLFRHTLHPIPDFIGTIGLFATAAALALTLGGLHALGTTAFRSLANQHARTLELGGIVAILQGEVEEARARTMATQEATDRLIATLSHELRTPLSTVQGYTEIVLEDLENTRLGGIEHDLRQVQTAAAQLLDRIGGMLELTPIDPYEGDLAVVPVDVAGVMADAVGIVVRRLDGSGSRVRFLDSSDQLRFCTDLLRFRHLVVQLLSHSASLVRNGVVTVQWRMAGDHLVLDVHDEGPGLVETRPGARPDLRATGLHGPRRLIAELEGTLDVLTTPGRGTTLRVRLPDLDRPAASIDATGDPTIFPPAS